MNKVQNPFDHSNPNQISAILDVMDRKPRIVQVIQACNEEALIEPCILQVYDQADKIIVIEGAVQSKVDAGQATKDGHSLDRTVEIIKDVKKNKDPDKKIIFVQIDRAWTDLEELKNCFFQYMQENDWMLITDVDEFIHPDVVDRLRSAISIEPYATEFVPTFYHFWRDKDHIRNPETSDGSWGVQHQRFIKFQPGMQYRTHPVVTDPHGHCTYFSPQYLPRRFVLPGFDIFHYSYMNFRKDAILEKKEFYNKELGQTKHGVVGSYERGGATDEFVNYTEPDHSVLRFNGAHPETITKQLWFNQLDEKLSNKQFAHYKTAQPYSLDRPQLIWAWRDKPGYDRLFNQVEIPLDEYMDEFET